MNVLRVIIENIFVVLNHRWTGHFRKGMGNNSIMCVDCAFLGVTKFIFKNFEFKKHLKFLPNLSTQTNCHRFQPQLTSITYHNEKQYFERIKEDSTLKKVINEHTQIS